MSGDLILDDAEQRLSEIVDYTKDRWGEAQAIRYFEGITERFEQIVQRTFPWRAIPAEFEIEGWVCRYERHYIYWKLLSDARIGIVTILHERMHQMNLVRDAFTL